MNKPAFTNAAALMGRATRTGSASVTRLVLHFHGALSLGEIEQALRAAGMHVRDDGRRRLFVERIPAFLKREADSAARNVPAPLLRVVNGGQS
ncbi:MAG TPA: hypothetical protein VNU21_15245 [Usitatibacter sp.]|nr:hypothetical protein [Usitatibacter sp.]